MKYMADILINFELNVFDITMFRNMSDIAMALRIISTILHYSKDDKMRLQKP